MCFIAFVSCKKTTDKKQETTFTNDLLAKKALITYEQEMIVPEEYFFFKSIDFPNFVNSLKTKTIEKEIQAYLPFSDIVCNNDDIQQKFHDEFFLNEFSSLIFEEEWQLDSAQFIMNKKVNSYSLVRKYIRNDSYRGEIPTKSIVAKYDFSKSGFPTKTDTNFVLLAKDVAYEVPLVNEENPEFLENISVKQIAKVLVEKALSGTIDCYSFSFRDSLILHSPEEVKKDLGKETTCYEEENEGIIDTICVDKDIDIGEICGVAFIEDWYVNKHTMEIYKDVKGIAPIRAFYHTPDNDTQSELVKSIPFVMYFKNHDKGK